MCLCLVLVGWFCFDVGYVSIYGTYLTFQTLLDILGSDRSIKDYYGYGRITESSFGYLLVLVVFSRIFSFLVLLLMCTECEREKLKTALYATSIIKLLSSTVVTADFYAKHEETVEEYEEAYTLAMGANATLSAEVAQHNIELQTWVSPWWKPAVMVYVVCGAISVVLCVCAGRRTKERDSAEGE